jgi:hypothetical protein
MPSVPVITIVENGEDCLALHRDEERVVTLWAREDSYQWFLLGRLDHPNIVPPALTTDSREFTYLAGVTERLEEAFEAYVAVLPDA